MMDRAFESELYPTHATPLPSARRVVVFAAHADDEVYGCGGTLCLFAKQGTPISVVIVTQGGRCLKNASQEIGHRRRRESLEASRVIGYPPPEFWDFPDRELRYTETFIGRVEDKLGQTDPDLIFAPAVSEMHPDHQVLALAVSEAVRRMGGTRVLAFYEVSAPTTPNALIDISAVVDVKIQAMQCFTSQEALYPYCERILALNRYRAYVLGKRADAAEAFLMVESNRLGQGLASVCETWLARRRCKGLAVDPSELPLVSIIVRWTGRSEFSEALESIAAQTYPHLEVVLVDAKGDGVFPENPYATRLHFTTVTVGEPLSRSRAANAGLGRASGQYLMFLDEDDLLLPDHVWRLVTALRIRRGVRAAYGGVRTVDEKGTSLLDYDEPWSVDRMLAANFIPIMAVLFDRSLLDDGCRFDEDLQVSEDWDFWMQLLQHTAFVHVPGISAIYRYYLGESKLSRERDHDFYLYWRKRVLEKWFRTLGLDPFASALHQLALGLDEAKRRSVRLEMEKEDLSREKEDLSREKEDLSREKEDLVRHNTDLRHELDETHRSLAAQVQENQQILLENTLLRDRVADVERERDILLNSTVWRLTSPLRSVAGWLRHLKRGVQGIVS